MESNCSTEWYRASVLDTTAEEEGVVIAPEIRHRHVNTGLYQTTACLTKSSEQGTFHRKIVFYYHNFILLYIGYLAWGKHSAGKRCHPRYGWGISGWELSGSETQREAKRAVAWTRANSSSILLVLTSLCYHFPPLSTNLEKRRSERLEEGPFTVLGDDIAETPDTRLEGGAKKKSLMGRIRHYFSVSPIFHEQKTEYPRQLAHKSVKSSGINYSHGRILWTGTDPVERGMWVWRLLCFAEDAAHSPGRHSCVSRTAISVFRLFF